VEDLLAFLFKNWWLLIILLPWIASTVGDVFTKAARKAAEEQRAGRRAGRGVGPGGAGSEQPLPAKRPSAEEVAAEIRRMMGMEVVEEGRSPSGSRPVVLEEEWEQAPGSEEAEWQEAEWQEVPAEPAPLALPEPKATQEFDNLHQRMAQKDAAQISNVQDRHLHPATASGGLHDRHIDTGLMKKLRARRGSRQNRRRSRILGVHGIAAGELVDLSHPARAFVMLDVMGPPKALRDESF